MSPSRGTLDSSAICAADVLSASQYKAGWDYCVEAAVAEALVEDMVASV